MGERLLRQLESIDDTDNEMQQKFGAGSRTCIGRHISFLEMSKLIPRLVRDFDFALDDTLSSPDQHMKTAGYWFVKPKDFRVKIRPRNKSKV